MYFDNVPYEDAIQILEHAQAYRMKLCLKRKPEIIKTEPAMETELIPVTSFWSDCLFKPFAMGFNINIYFLLFIRRRSVVF